MPSRPTVAIVGRPNVGKSRLFNRLVGERRSIVHDFPGVTRDRIVAPAELDDGFQVELVDTGGLVPPEEDALRIRDQVALALDSADAILLVTDASVGCTVQDVEIASSLRKIGKPVVVAANKMDIAAARLNWTEFHSLGLGDPVPLSAEHGTGFLELARRLRELLPEEGLAPESEPERIRVALVGRPNVGKSSLLNQLLGVPRAIVSDRPGTTREAVDSALDFGEHSFLLVDTAGIRRRSRCQNLHEEVAIWMARRQLERAEVGVLVVEAPAGITGGDLAVAGLLRELGRAAVVAVNQWDRLTSENRQALERTWPRLAELLHDPPRVNLSARTGRGLGRLLPAVVRVHEAYHRALPTAALNASLREALERHAPPTLESGKRWRCYYATQVGSGPPTFMLFVNRVLPVGHSYRRYLENRLRETLGASGVPVRLVMKTRRERRSGSAPVSEGEGHETQLEVR